MTETKEQRIRRQRAEACKRYRQKNPARCQELVKAYQRAHPEKVQSWNRERKYGVTTEQWEAKFELQGRKCAICGGTDPGSKKGWHTDHDHVTGALRSILCAFCNTGLGFFKDSSSLLQKAALYLISWGEKCG